MSNIVPIKGNLAISGASDRLAKLMGVMVTPSSGTVFPRISTNKSRFSITRSGEDPVYLKDGNNYISELSVIVLSANPGVYKTFYEKEYVPGTEPEAPACWSNSGDAPHGSSPKKQAKTCAECPMNVFGSKITQSGAKAKRCSDAKRILVVSPNDISGEVYMVNISATALKTWNTYVKMLARGGVYPQTVLTKLSFEEDVEYPKLSFQYAGTLDAAQINTVLARLDEPEIDEFSSGVADTESEFGRVADNEEVPAAQKPAAKAAAKPAHASAKGASAFGMAAEPGETTKPEETAEPKAEQDADVPATAPAVDSEVRSLLGF